MPDLDWHCHHVVVCMDIFRTLQANNSSWSTPCLPCQLQTPWDNFVRISLSRRHNGHIITPTQLTPIQRFNQVILQIPNSTQLLLNGKLATQLRMTMI